MQLHTLKTMKKTIGWRVSDIHTVVSAELFAIYKALVWIDDGDPRNDRYVIFTESLASVYMIGNGCTSYSYIISEIHRLLHKIIYMGKLIKIQ